MALQVVYLLSFLDAFNFALIIPLVNLHVLALGGSYMLCGILQSAGAGMQLFASPVIGSWSDTYGRRLILLCTLMGILLSDGLSSFNSLYIFCTARILGGISRHTDPLLKAIITDLVPEKKEQGEVFNKLLAIPGVSFIIAPIMGGLLHQYFNSFAFISCIMCGIDVLVIAITFMYVKDIKRDKTPKTSTSRNWKKYTDLLSIKFVVEAAYNFLFMNTGLIYTQNYSFTRTQIGLSVGYMSGTMIVGALLTPYINKRFYANDTNGSKRILHGLGLMVASFTLLINVNSAFLHLGIFIPASLAKMMLEIAWTESLTARTSESEKGFMMGVAASMMSAAGLVCPLISGVLADYVGIDILKALPVIPSLIGLLTYRQLKLHIN